MEGCALLLLAWPVGGAVVGVIIGQQKGYSQAYGAAVGAVLGPASVLMLFLDRKRPQ
jgi:hypothetical protein